MVLLLKSDFGCYQYVKLFMDAMLCCYGTPHNKFTLRNHGKPYLAYASTIQVRLTLEESTLTKVRTQSYLRIYIRCTRVLQ